MAPMKATKAAVKSLTKGGIAEAVAAETELKKSEVTKVLNSLANVAAMEVKLIRESGFHLCRGASSLADIW